MTARHLQFAALMAIYGFLGLMPSTGTAGIGRLDLVAHLGGWLVGTISGCYAYPRVSAVRLGTALWGYSLLIETAQIAVPTRSFELLDLVANAAGIALGFMAVRLIPSDWRP